MGVCIVGWAHGPFGRHDGLDLEGLVASVSGRAIEHAGVPAQDIDATWLGNLNGGFVPANASYVKEEAATGMTFPGIFGQMARQYFSRYGDHRATLARIAAKNHHNGVRNPYAQVRKDLGFEFCNTVSDKNPLVADPLRKTDCSLVSDGAVALVLADEKTA